MRILSIQGCNLASLAGAFKLDLTRGPVGRAGLFAITGPTGSGKSTLLDALCLALFDDTPRLSNADRSVRIGEGRQRLTAQDPRTLLRRDAGSGYAEVRFIGVDGGTWRARWSCRRSRGRPGEQPQTQTMELENLDTNERSDGTRSQLKEEIVQRLGLSFEQFRRSALLAQGEFAAFLHAKPRQRAELLERMTGTEIYALLSKAAFDKAKAAKEGLTGLSDQQQRLGVLSTLERQGLEQQRTLAEERVREADEVLKAVRAVLHWERQCQELRRQRTESTARLQKAEQTLGEPWVSTLQRAREVAPLGKLLEEIAQLRTLAPKPELLEQAQREIDALTQQQEGLARARTQAETEREQAGPRLEQAAGLDGQLEQLQRQEREKTAQATQARAQASQIENRLRAHRDGLERWTQQLDAAERWLKANDHQDLATAWRQGTKEDLQRWVQAMHELGAAQRELDPLQSKLKASREREQACGRDLEASQREAALAHQAVDALPRESPDLQRLGLLKEHRELMDQARRESTALDRAQQQLEQLQRELQGLEKELTELGAELVQQTKDTQVAEHRADQAAAALLFEEHRKVLRPGEPCPLCGAKEHPRANQVMDALSQDLAQEAGQAREQLASLQLQVARQETARDRVRPQLEQQERLCKGHQDTLNALTDRWRLPGTPTGDPTALQTELGQLEQAALRMTRLEAQRSKAQQVLRDRRAAVEQARISLEKARTRSAELVDLCAPLKNTILTTQGHLESEAADLDGRLPQDWSKDALREGAVHDLEDTVQAWEQQCTLRDQARAGLDDDHLQSLLASAKRAAENAAKQEREAEAALGALQQRQRERAALLGGESVAQVRDRLARAERDAETAHRAAREKLARAQENQVAAAARAKDAQLRHDKLAQALERGRQELGLDEHALREALREAPWITLHTEKLERAREELTSARALESDRTSSLKRLEENPPSSTQDLPGAEASHKKATRELSELELKLEKDDTAQHDLAALADEVALATREHRRWESLNQLIGASDGHRFRTFAQGLTLTTLLSHANATLLELAPRYALRRVEGGNLDFQVIDRDMGDEARSVSSLSGGETFMVSLALALGLSSMASHETRVDTLFIDEGFGSLDEDSLHTAISTLDALQKTGRKVGVISHVQGLAERIDVQVRVQRQTGGRSILRIEGA